MLTQVHLQQVQSLEITRYIIITLTDELLFPVTGMDSDLYSLKLIKSKADRAEVFFIAALRNNDC